MSGQPFDDSMQVGEARALLEALAAHGGARCPCCTQWAQVHRWTLYAGAAHMLILMYRKGGTSEFVESKSCKLPGQGGDATRLRIWALAEHEKDRRPDGGKSGWWRVTPLGEMFVLRFTTIPKYAWVYDNRLLRHGGPAVTIDDALGTKFSYDEVMSA